MLLKLKSFSASLNYATWAELSSDFILAQGLIDENIYAIKTTKSIIKQEFAIDNLMEVCLFLEYVPQGVIEIEISRRPPLLIRNKQT
jgi:hypothetical protein